MVTLSAAEAFWMLIAIQEMAPVATPDQPMVPPHIRRQDAVQFLLGGGETRLRFEYASDGWPATPMTISKLRLTLQAVGQDPVKLAVRLEPDAAATRIFVDVPDITWSGKLEIVAEWQDPCFTYRAMTSSPVLVDPAASVEGCARRTGNAFDELAAIFEPPLTVGGTDADLVGYVFSGKVAPLPVIDPPPPYLGFDQDSPVLVRAPRTTVGVSSENDLIELHAGPSRAVTLYRRGELLRWIEGGWIYGVEERARVVFRSELVEHPDGTFTFDVPADPGRYAAEILFDYDSACSFGTAGFVVGIDVE